MNRAKYDDPDAPLQLLLEWDEPLTPSRFLRAAVPAVIMNIACALMLLAFIDSVNRHLPPDEIDFKNSIPLFAPKILKLTQKDPNHGKVKEEITSSSARQPSRAQTRQFRPPTPVTQPSLPSRALTIPEPPQFQASVTPPQLNGIIPAPTQTAERPRVGLDNVVSALPMKAPSERPAIAAPNAQIAELPSPMSRASGRPGESISPGPSLESSDAKAELVSDPLGADFKAYLSNLSNLVYSRWQRGLNASQRTALVIRSPGQVVVKCAIDRRGKITQIEVTAHASLAALDQAAKLSVSDSQPFPPLPADYKGDEILLNVTLSYKP